jgi:anti-repressor protein
MEQIIKIQQQGAKSLVSARELHQFLGVQSPFTHWCNRMFEYGFEENQDFLLVKFDRQKGSGGHNKTDFLLTLDTAKEIAMIQRTAKGKEVRNYFIACERLMVEMVQAANPDGIVANQAELHRLKAEKKALRAKIQPDLKRMQQIGREMGRRQNETFSQLRLFDPQSTISPTTAPTV